VNRRTIHTSLRAVGALVLIGACGSSDDSASPTTNPPTIDATTTSAPPTSRFAIPCASARDAARAASAAYYANTMRFPTTFRELTAGPTPVLELGEATLVDDTTLTGRTWTLTIAGDGTDVPEFECTDRP
jgi:hypothetical protein